MRHSQHGPPQGAKRALREPGGSAYSVVSGQPAGSNHSILKRQGVCTGAGAAGGSGAVAIGEVEPTCEAFST